jgi:hypothetical protein
MALNPQSLLAQLSPARGLDLSGAGQSSSLERQRLDLARKQFEAAQKRAKERDELERLKAGNALIAKRLELQKAQEKAAAVAAAKQQEQRLAAVQKTSDLAMAGNAQGALAMSPVLEMLGSGLEVQGQTDGLPRMRVIPDRAVEAGREQAAWQQGPHPIDSYDGEQSATQSLAQMGGMGYPANEQGTLDDPNATRARVADEGTLELGPSGELDPATTDAITPGEADMATAAEHDGGVADVSVGAGGMGPASLGTGDAFAQALLAGEYARQRGEPARGPDEPDDVGAVPRDVLDMGALHSLTMRRLSPALKAATEAYTDDASKESALSTAQMAAASGLPMDKALELYNQSRSGPDATRRAQLMADAQQDKFRETRDELTPVQAEQLKGEGFKRGNTNYKNSKIADDVGTLEAAKTVTALLQGDPRNHEKVVNALMLMTHNKGPQTEADALRVIGHSKISSIEQLEEWLHTKAIGGFSGPDKDAIQEFIDMQSGLSRDKVFGWLDQNDGQMNNPKTHERVRAGYEEFRNGGAIPPDLLDEYEATRAAEAEEDKKASGGKPAAQSAGGAASTPNYRDYSDFDLDLEGQALENDLDPDKIRAVMGPESGGRADARNDKSGATGLIQFLPSIAKGLGTSTEELSKMSASEQLPYVVKYLQGHGITSDSPPEDYVMAVAAPAFIGKSADTVVYPKGSPAWRDNEAWRPPGGGDITVGSIRRFYEGRGSRQASGAPTLRAKTALDQEVLDSLGLGL